MHFVSEEKLDILCTVQILLILLIGIKKLQGKIYILHKNKSVGGLPLHFCEIAND